MILGIGTDIIEIDRIAQISPERFSRRILNEDELIYYSHSKRIVEHLAGRFAAKEAISKALGTGIGAELSFRDISIIKDEKGAPRVQLSKQVMDYFFPNRNAKIHLSISHSRRYAVATAVIEVD